MSRHSDSRGGIDRHGHGIHGRDGVALLTAAEAAALDADASTRAGVPPGVLMENAGRAAAQLVHAFHPDGLIVAVAGAGNNGGDAVVAARVLLGWGRDVVLVHAGARPPAAHLTHGHDLPVLAGNGAVAAVEHAAVVIDGILGTGASGAPRGSAADWIAHIARARGAVVALDLPSGIDATSGAVAAQAVNADLTVTFGWPKLGMLLLPARRCCGRIIAVEIGFPPLERFDAEAITPGWAHARLPVRAADAHKSTVGRVFVLAGSTGMAGAAVLCANAAQRAGAGYVRIGSVAENRVIVQTAVPEATFVDAAQLDDAAFAGMDALVAGPGIGTHDGALAALGRALELTPELPTLLDADALNLFARDADELRAIARGRPLLITPHPGEMARLLASNTADIAAAPVDAAREASARFGAAVLLKGQPSIIAMEGEPLLVATAGSSDLATAGMGDHLAGVAGAFLAAGAPPRVAAGLALQYSGRAAQLARRGRSLSPRDVTAALPRAFARSAAYLPPVAFPFIVFDQPAPW